MKIFTAAWSTKLPPNHIRISISRGAPRFIKGTQLKLPELAPGPWFNSVSVEEYKRLYRAQLAELDIIEIMRKVGVLAGSENNPVLCCFEKAGSDDWCHRGLLSEWFADNEYILEEIGIFGYALNHPLHPDFKKSQGELL